MKLVPKLMLVATIRFGIPAFEYIGLYAAEEMD